MIISKTPFRISFFGGGTDYPVWFQENGGAVIGASIDKYCYVTVRRLPPYFDYHSRILYSRTEYVHDNEQIMHPAVREGLAFLGITEGVEVYHRGDLPANRGMGTSSAFMVGLLNALYEMTGGCQIGEYRQNQLATDAIYVEQNMIGENVGCQDQWLCARGGLNHIVFWPGGYNWKVLPLPFPEGMEDWLMLVDTGTSRFASEIAAYQIQETPRLSPQLDEMRKLVAAAIPVMANKDWLEFGKLMNESWAIKRSLTARISTPFIDEVYSNALRAGAVGGKLLGAGGGGFMLFVVSPERQRKVKEALDGLLHIPFRFETAGTQIIFADNS